MFQWHKCSFSWKKNYVTRSWNKRGALSSMEFFCDSLLLYELLGLCIVSGGCLGCLGYKVLCGWISLAYHFLPLLEEFIIPQNFILMLIE